MKPLNRPMFKMGGPVKEGIMDGIREPRQNYFLGGGVVLFATESLYPLILAPVVR